MDATVWPRDTDALRRWALIVIVAGLTVAGVAGLSGVAHAAGAADAAAGSESRDDDLELIGEGEYRWFGLRVYRAAFSTQTGSFTEWEETEQARLEIYYYRGVSASKLIEIARKEWDRIGIDAPPRWFGWLRQILPDVEEGDTLSCVVWPGERAVFYHNGEKAGEVTEPDFGPAFLSIWLHPDARAAGLRRALLGESGRS